MATTSPWSSEAQLDEAYGNWCLGDAVLRRTRASLARRLDRALPPGPILDMGAGDGTLMEAFARHGREAVGLEPHASGPHLRDAGIEEISGAWAAVIFCHSLEHLRQPAKALSHAASLLVPGGLLVVAVPNAASLQARAFGDRWFALDLPRHLVHLSRHRCCPRSRRWDAGREGELAAAVPLALAATAAEAVTDRAISVT